MFFKVNKGNYINWHSKTFEEMIDYLSSFEFKEHEILRMLNYCKEHKNLRYTIYGKVGDDVSCMLTYKAITYISGIEIFLYLFIRVMKIISYSENWWLK